MEKIFPQVKSFQMISQMKNSFSVSFSPVSLVPKLPFLLLPNLVFQAALNSQPNSLTQNRILPSREPPPMM